MSCALMLGWRRRRKRSARSSTRRDSAWARTAARSGWFGMRAPASVSRIGYRDYCAAGAGFVNRQASVDLLEGLALVHGDVVGLVAFDLVLRVLGRTATHVSLVFG